MEAKNESRESGYQLLKKERMAIQQRINGTTLEYSIKSNLQDLVQKTTPSALEKIIGLVNSAKRRLKEKKNDRLEEFEHNTPKLSVEQLVIGEELPKTKIKNREER